MINYGIIEIKYLYHNLIAEEKYYLYLIDTAIFDIVLINFEIFK